MPAPDDKLTPEEELELEGLIRRQKIRQLEAEIAAEEQLALPDSAFTAGDTHRLLKQKALEARAAQAGTAPQQQTMAERNTPLPRPETKPEPEQTFTGRIRDRFNANIDRASGHLLNGREGGSALRGVLSLGARAVSGTGIGSQEQQRKDLADLGNTSLGVLEVGLAPFNAASHGVVGYPLGEVAKRTPLKVPEDRAFINFNGGDVTIPQRALDENAENIDDVATMVTEGYGPSVVMKIFRGLAGTSAAKKAAETVNKANPIKTPSPKPYGDGDFDVVFSDRIIKSITDEAQTVLKNADKPTQRLYMEIADSITAQHISPTEIGELMAKRNMDLGTFVEVFKASASGAGRTLGRFSHASRGLAKALEDTNPELAASLLKRAEDSAPFGDRLFRAVQQTDEFRRLGGTSQIKTAVRNAVVSGPVMAIGALDKSLEILLHGGFTKDAFGDAFKVFGQWSQAAKQMNPLRPLKTKASNADLLARLETIPAAARGTRIEELQGVVGIADAAIPTGVLGDKARKAIELYNKGEKGKAVGKGLDLASDATKRGLSVFNRMQEKPMRMAATELRLLQMKGVKTIDEIDFTKLTKAEVDEVTDFAMEVTFANDPKSEVGRTMLRAFKMGAPLTTSIAPYPRFMFYSAPRWLFNHSPYGLLKIVGGKNLDQLAKGDVRRTAKIISEATTGALALSASGVFLNSDMAGDKHQEVKTPDGGNVSLQAFQPPTNFLTLAKVIDDPDSVKPKEYLELLTSLRSTRGTPIELITAFQHVGTGDWEGVKDAAMRIAGNYIGMMTVPFRMVKDAVSILDPQERVDRDTQQRPVIGPSLANMPRLSQSLPPRRKITEGGNVQADTSPWVSQLTGISVDYRPEIETALNRAGLETNKLYPRTGVDEADAYIVREVGYQADRYGRQLLQADRYRLANNKAEQAMFLQEVFADFTARAKAHMAMEDPRLFARMILESRLDDLEKQRLEAYGVDPRKLENIIQTGTPEPVNILAPGEVAPGTGVTLHPPQ